MNGQPAFGAAVGFPAGFFLLGFLYNALGINEETALGVEWTPFSIWLMIMVNVAVVSSMVLSGSDTSVVSAIVSHPLRESPKRWFAFISGPSESRLHLVNKFDCGVSKMSWIKQSTAVVNHSWLRRKIDIGVWQWASFVLVTCFLTLTPALMACGLAYRLPFPKHGC